MSSAGSKVTSRILTVHFLVLTVGCIPAGAQTPERIAEIRVHGNHTTPDTDILTLSGLTPGQAGTEEEIRAAERRLTAAGRFENVEVRRRFLSIADPSQILIVIVVDEHPAVSASNLTPGPFSKLRAAQMYLPILKHADGYGMTYGVRVAFANALGERSRLSVPLTWGGERRVGVEADRQFDGPISTLRGGVSLYRRVNPHFDAPDTRQEARVEAERVVTDWLRVGGGARLANVEFGDAGEARHTAGGLHAVIDTRIDPSFPRNAVHARAAWERLSFEVDAASRWSADVRGYVAIGGSRVLALRGVTMTSDAALPHAEQVLLGGSDTVRGYRTGHRAGDNLAAATIEIRQPLTSPLSIGRFGVKAFIDAGTTWAHGRRLRDEPFDRGLGGGLYFGAGPFVMDLDVAWPEEGRPRLHFGMGVTF